MIGYEVRIRAVDPDLGPFPIIQSGATQFRVFQLKSKRFDQMQPATGIRTKTDDIPRIGRNLRRNKNDVEQN